MASSFQTLPWFNLMGIKSIPWVPHPSQDHGKLPAQTPWHSWVTMERAMQMRGLVDLPVLLTLPGVGDPV